MMKSEKLLVISLFLIVLWIGFVVASGYGWNAFQIESDFSNPGAFGDSFGPLGAMMAALAAYAAFETLGEQRSEITRSRDREIIEEERRGAEEKRRQKRDKEQAQIERRTVFESTFFNLLSAFRGISQETDVGVGEDRKTSRDAFQRIASRLVQNYNIHSNLETAWTLTIKVYKNDLNHYFRFLYHIIKYVDSQKGIEKYFYIRLVRAALSEAELVLLFANCATGEGKSKFLPLVEKYALLHNVSQESRSKWDMEKFINPSAFGSS